jgi:hypothetical protein
MSDSVLVEVRERLHGSWSPGFEVVEETGSGVRLRRISDGTHLPGEVRREDVRAVDGAGTPGWPS